MSGPNSPTAAPSASVSVPAKPKGFGVTALVLGIVSIALCWIPVMNIFTGIITGIVGAVFGLIGLFKSHRVMSIVGLVTAVLGFVFAILVNTAFANAVDQATRQLDGVTSPPAVAPVGPTRGQQDANAVQQAAPESQDSSVTYSVRSSGATINTVSYVTPGFNISQDQPGNRSWSKKVAYDDNGDLGWNMNAQLNGSGTITCTVKDNATGKTVTNTSHGQYVMVSCSMPIK